MGETYSKVSALFKLNSSDFLKGAVVAIFSAVVIWLADLIKVPGFDLFALSWSEVLRVAVTAFVAYLGKNFLTAENGKIGGVL